MKPWEGPTSIGGDKCMRPNYILMICGESVLARNLVLDLDKVAAAGGAFAVRVSCSSISALSASYSRQSDVA